MPLFHLKTNVPVEGAALTELQNALTKMLAETSTKPEKVRVPFNPFSKIAMLPQRWAQQDDHKQTEECLSCDSNAALDCTGFQVCQVVVEVLPMTFGGESTA